MLLKRKGYLVEVTTKIISLNLCKALMQEHRYTFHKLYSMINNQDFKYPPFKYLKEFQQSVS